jgi:SAM-dependent methyltransferase
MNPDTYEFEAQTERDHWWFNGRRRMFMSIVERCVPDRSAPILDIGTSTGGTLRALSEHGYSNLHGLDLSAEAIKFCNQQGFNAVKQGDVSAMPFSDGDFDFIFASDVIEHTDDDVKAAREIYRVLKPERYALFTVPAFRILWSRQDDIAHHKQRYNKTMLISCLRRAGFNIVESYYFNYLLFLPILGTRLAMKTFGFSSENEIGLNTPLVNKVCSVIFNADVDTARHLHPPFGVSICALVRR